MSQSALSNPKLYYTITEVAQQLTVTPSLIRFYEKQFNTLRPQKINRRGVRMYTPEEITQLKTVFDLTKNKGMTLKGAQAYLKKNKSSIDLNHEIQDTLMQLKQFLLDISNQLE